MGTVELCLRVEGTYQRLVAMKRLLPVLREDEDVRAMFLDEARIAGLLRHPNVVSVTDVGEDDDGPFLVMDYIEGMSLHGMRTRLRERMPHGIAARIVAACARGLHAAHELQSHEGTWLGLVHRDISPHNVLVGFDGRVLLTDFGIAKALGRQTRTSTGLLKGKLSYMAPEQLRFEEVDRRSDIFALGVVLYELLTGTRLFEGEPREIAQNILNGKIAPLHEVRPDVPEALVSITMQMLAMSVSERPTTAEEVAVRLEEWLRAEGTSDAPSLVAMIAAEFGEEQRTTSEKVARLVAELPAETTPVPELVVLTEPDAPSSPARDETAAATPQAIAEQGNQQDPSAKATRRLPTSLWVVAACFVLVGVSIWMTSIMSRHERVAPTATLPEPPLVVHEEPAPIEFVAPQPTIVETPTVTESPPAEAPRAREGRRRRRDPMGRWSWE